MKISLIVCWYGNFPNYFPIWLKSCEKNKDIDFLIFSDSDYDGIIPSNVKIIHFHLDDFVARAENILGQQIHLDKPYRVCDYRPMFGLVFKEELKKYDFWGYCDIDLIFGNISHYLHNLNIDELEAVFNRGHFTLIRNNDKMNNLFKKDGSLFNYKAVVKHDAIFAFDENTGIQRIAKKEMIRAVYSLPYVDADEKYCQLRSRFEKHNPLHQAFYWERGILYRVKYENDFCYMQETMYIHLQKRKLMIKDSNVVDSLSFWIEPDGFCIKDYLGLPPKDDIDLHNPFYSDKEMKRQLKVYRIKKIKNIMKRNLFQIYVRIMQQKAGINSDDGTKGSGRWEKY